MKNATISHFPNERDCPFLSAYCCCVEALSIQTSFSRLSTDLSMFPNNYERKCQPKYSI
jgi:hypothetical protein